MKVLLNTTTSAIGGALQVAAAFTIQALRDPGPIEWAFATSRATANELAKLGVNPSSQMHVFDRSATLSLKSRRRLLAIEAEFQPDCVLTLEGPAYVRFRSFHVLGCSTAWVTHATWSAVQSLGSPVEWGICIGRNAYKSLWFRRADAWIAQTETARRGLAHRLRLPLERIGLVLNTCGEHYLANQGVRPFPEPGQQLRIFCFSYPHRHKGLKLIPQIVRQLADRRPNLDFRIVVTLPPNPITSRVMAEAARLNVTHLLENRGAIPIAEGPKLYSTSDICLLPTLLETFSATYPEAMAIGLPIVTTDLGFAHDVCDDAALYFTQKDAGAATDCILKLIDDRQLWERQIARGKEVLKRFPTPTERYHQFIDLLISLRAKYGADAGKTRPAALAHPE